MKHIVLAACLLSACSCKTMWKRPPPETRHVNSHETNVAIAVLDSWSEVYGRPTPQACWALLGEMRIAITEGDDFRRACKACEPTDNDCIGAIRANSCYKYRRCYNTWTGARCDDRWPMVVVHQSMATPVSYEYVLVHEFIHMAEDCHGIGFNYGHNLPERWHDAGNTARLRAASVEGRSRTRRHLEVR